MAIGNNLVDTVDPNGLTPITTALEQIAKYLNVDEEEQAASTAKRMFQSFFVWGSELEPLAADCMRNWYNGAPKNPWPIDGDEVKAIISDTTTPKKDQLQDVKGVKNTHEQVKEGACSWVKGAPKSGKLDSSTAHVHPYVFKSKYYHAIGGFELTFSGSYTCVGSVYTFDGTWSLSDNYSFKPGAKTLLLGDNIPDDYALLVEKYFGAKPFDITGSYKGERTYDCGDSSNENQSPSRKP